MPHQQTLTFNITDCLSGVLTKYSLIKNINSESPKSPESMLRMDTDFKSTDENYIVNLWHSNLSVDLEKCFSIREKILLILQGKLKS